MKDQKYLQNFLLEKNKLWDHNWKLIDTRIDGFTEDDITKLESGDKKEIRLDTNCILEWNKNTNGNGVMLREIISSNFQIEEESEFLYRNDSIYAGVSIIRGERLQYSTERIEFWNRKIACRPCDQGVYTKYADDIPAIEHEELNVLDSTGQIQCTYSSPKHMGWHYSETIDKLQITLFSDTIITSDNPCSFVEIKNK